MIQHLDPQTRNAYIREQGLCKYQGCWQPGHTVKDCPLRAERQQTVAAPQEHQPSPAGRVRSDPDPALLDATIPEVPSTELAERLLNVEMAIASYDVRFQHIDSKLGPFCDRAQAKFAVSVDEAVQQANAKLNRYEAKLAAAEQQLQAEKMNAHSAQQKVIQMQHAARAAMAHESNGKPFSTHSIDVNKWLTTGNLDAIADHGRRLWANTVWLGKLADQTMTFAEERAINPDLPMPKWVTMDDIDPCMTFVCIQHILGAKPGETAGADTVVADTDATVVADEAEVLDDPMDDAEL